MPFASSTSTDFANCTYMMKRILLSLLILLFVVLQVVINYRLSDIQPFIYAQF